MVPAVIGHTAKVKHDGLIDEPHLPNIEVPRCQTCGATYPTDAVDDKVSDALRERRRLLTPDQLRDGIKAVDLNQQEVAERLGVAPETISRWVNGVLIQSRAMDNLLRGVLRFSPGARTLRGANQDPDLGLRSGVSVTG